MTLTIKASSAKTFSSIGPCQQFFSQDFGARLKLNCLRVKEDVFRETDYERINKTRSMCA